MTKKWFRSLLWICTLTAALQGQTRESVLKAIQQTSKWSPADNPVLYDEKNIETLAPKRAVAINHYGLTGATTQTWAGPEGEVHLTLYEMVDPSAAYGLFTLDRNADQPAFSTIPIGTEGFRLGNYSEFWQSKYVVKLEGTSTAAEKLGRVISENIFGRSRKPPVSSHLPPENLVQGSEKYIVDATGIGRALDLDPDNLGFNDSVEIAIADYRVNAKTAHLVLLMYPTQQLAKKYEDQWSTLTPNDAPFRKRVGALLAMVRGSRDHAISNAILDHVNYETQVTYAEPRPDISLRQVILTIFTFIGIGLLFTVVAGLSFGGLRIFVKARYPDRVFDRPQDMEIIQLKLGQGVIPKQLRE
jgi:Family of unknown function (DUF6599)